MLVPKKNCLAVYQYLFKEGVLVAKKDVTSAKHGQVEVPNLQVLNLMKSLKSRGFVKEEFCWSWFYYSLTNEGIEFLREYLHVSADTVPATLRKPAKAQPPHSFARPGGERGGGRGGRGGRGGGREGYRDGAREDRGEGGRGGGVGRGGRGGRGRGGFGGGASEAATESWGS